jgi:hypothetical protein
MADKLTIQRSLTLEPGRVDFEDIGIFAFMAELQLDAGIQHPEKPVQLRIKNGGIVGQLIRVHSSMIPDYLDTVMECWS